MNPALMAAFADELEKLALAGVGKANSGAAPKGITSAKALAVAPMKVAKPVASKGGGVMKFKTTSIKSTKNHGQSVSVSPNSGATSISTPPITPKAPTANIG